MGLGGLEPPTSSLSVKRSNHLSYRPKSLVNFSRLRVVGQTLLLVGETNAHAAGDAGDYVEDQRADAG